MIFYFPKILKNYTEIFMSIKSDYKQSVNAKIYLS